MAKGIALMIDSQKLSNIKACVVAIGLVENKEESIKPLTILGSGFFVNKEGFVLTAAHVFRACVPIFHEFDEKGTKTNIAAFHVRPNRNGFNLSVLPLPFIKLYQPEKNIATAESFDIGIGIPKDYSKTVPFLEIKAFNPSALFKDIMICGYPNGNLSLGENESLRLSPTIQFGRVTGLIPIDSYPVPWGVQTDIIGTGGSSGSPLVDPSDGKVIGIAQKVLAASVEGNFFGLTREADGTSKCVTGKLGASARIGLVYGNTSDYFHNLHQMVKDNHEKGIETTKYQIPTVGAKLTELKTGPLDMSGNE